MEDGTAGNGATLWISARPVNRRGDTGTHNRAIMPGPST